MKKLLYILPAFALLFSCGSEKGNLAGNRFLTPKVVDKLLPEQYIFKGDSVFAYLERYTKDQATKSKQLFMQGLDLYINQQKAAEAAKVFRESILYYPDTKTYVYLANAYVDMGDTLRADSALTVFPEPSSDFMYAAARLEAVKKDTARAIEYLGEALGYGFTNKKRLESDKVFDYLRGTRGFTALIVTYLENDERLKAVLFRSFLASAPDLALPFTLPKDSICETNMELMYQKPSINYDFAPFIAGMEDSRFSRDVSNDYFMVGKFKTVDNFWAVIYKSVTVIVDTLPPVDVKMAVFDSLGNLLDEQTFAYFSIPATLTIGAIDEQKVITIKEYAMKWKSDPMETGYAGNEYLGEELGGEHRKIINKDGKIVPQKDDVVKK